MSSKVLTKDFINRLKERAKKLKEGKGLNEEEKAFYDDVVLFIEDFYDHMESIKWKEWLGAAVIIIGSIVIASVSR